jgi:hypothetical protein
MYLPNDQRYGHMMYRRCGASGLRLPAISMASGTTARSISVSRALA